MELRRWEVAVEKTRWQSWEQLAAASACFGGARRLRAAYLANLDRLHKAADDLFRLAEALEWQQTKEHFGLGGVLTPNELLIWRFIRNRGPKEGRFPWYAEIGREFQWSTKTISKAIKGLRAKGYRMDGTCL